MKDFKFIPVSVDDTNSLLQIYNYYILNSTATFHIEPITLDEMSSILFADDPLYESFIIKNENSILGYVLLTPYKKREAYRRSAEVTLYLHPDFIGLGVGTKAINFIEELARKKRIKTLLSIICGENISSIKLFEKCNYIKSGHLKNVGEKFGRALDIIIYQKEL